MRNASLLVSTALALVVGSAAHAGTIDFLTTGAVVDYTILQTGEYDIVAFGAQGGDVDFTTSKVGGLGAEIGGEFTLTAGTVLEIAVGGAGSPSIPDSGAGGGGGSFVFDETTGTLLIAAGGGGGAAIDTYSFSANGGPGQTTTSGQGGGGPDSTGGANGQGGSAGGSAASSGGGGGGFLSAGGSAASGGVGGGSWSGLAGGGSCTIGSDGGFGGGGGGCGGGGGGGGYSGGGGGGIAAGGGGGGSFLASLASDPILIGGVESGDGLVTLSSPALVVPEPATWTTLLIGFGGLGLAGYRRKRKGGASAVAN